MAERGGGGSCIAYQTKQCCPMGTCTPARVCLVAWAFLPNKLLIRLCFCPPHCFVVLCRFACSQRHLERQNLRGNPVGLHPAWLGTTEVRIRFFLFFFNDLSLREPVWSASLLEKPVIFFPFISFQTMQPSTHVIDAKWDPLSRRLILYGYLLCAAPGDRQILMTS